MTVISVLKYVGKLLIIGIAFMGGFVVGGMLARMLGLAAVIPEGVDAGSAMLALVLTSPVLAFGIALVARGIGGGFWTRTAILSFFTWIVYGVNTLLESSIILPSIGGALFSGVSYLVASVIAGAVAAFLLPAPEREVSFVAASRSFWNTRRASDWAIRLPLAAVVFMPIYYFFGLLAIQVTGPYYQQNVGGLTAPTLEQLLPILFVRSVLFLLACAPLLVMWRRSERSLMWSLGAALFILVGFVMLLAANWLPMIVRVTHGLEILADELVYAWALVKLIGPTKTTILQELPLRPSASPRI